MQWQSQETSSVSLLLLSFMMLKNPWFPHCIFQHRFPWQTPLLHLLHLHNHFVSTAGQFSFFHKLRRSRKLDQNIYGIISFCASSSVHYASHGNSLFVSCRTWKPTHQLKLLHFFFSNDPCCHRNSTGFHFIRFMRCRCARKQSSFVAMEISIDGASSGIDSDWDVKCENYYAHVHSIVH